MCRDWIQPSITPHEGGKKEPLTSKKQVEQPSAPRIRSFRLLIRSRPTHGMKLKT